MFVVSTTVSTVGSTTGDPRFDSHIELHHRQLELVHIAAKGLHLKNVRSMQVIKIPIGLQDSLSVLYRRLVTVTLKLPAETSSEWCTESLENLKNSFIIGHSHCTIYLVSKPVTVCLFFQFRNNFYSQLEKSLFLFILLSK